MKIAVISQMFPCRRHPTSAIFFANLMRELAAKVERLNIITPRICFPKFLTRFKPDLNKWFIDDRYSIENGMHIYRPFVPSIPLAAAAGVNGTLMKRALRPLLTKMQQQNQMDMLLGYNMIPEGIATVRLAEDFNLPSAFWVIGSDLHVTARHNRINSALSQKAVIKSDLVFAESRTLASEIIKLAGSSANVRTFYKGINTANFQDLPTKYVLMRRHNLDIRRRYILFVGRMMREKGIYELAEAFIQVARRYPDIDLIMIGEDIERREFLTRFLKTNLTHRVHLKGVLPYNQIAEYMKIAELLAFPSWAEGLPNVVLEAMAAGLPVVASDVDGIPEVLEDGVTGLAVSPKKPGELNAALVRMIEDCDLRRACSQNAQRLVIQNFDVKKNVELLIDHLNKLLEYRKTHVVKS